MSEAYSPAESAMQFIASFGYEAFSSVEFQLQQDRARAEALVMEPVEARRVDNSRQKDGNTKGGRWVHAGRRWG